jgi:lipid-binding SYLF domain-containing protein
VLSGLFAGLTLDGTILVERKDANRDFYGSTISSTDILRFAYEYLLMCVMLTRVIVAEYQHRK